MAIIQVFSVRDNKVNSFGRPFTAINEVHATRELIIAVNRGIGQLSMFPSDFDLFRLGDFDESTGMLNVGIPVLVCGCASLDSLEMKEKIKKALQIERQKEADHE